MLYGRAVDPSAVLDKAFELAANVGELMGAALSVRGLTPARAEAVLVLQQSGRPLVQRELAALLRCSARHVTGLVDVLERQGFVARVAHPTDRRATLVELTEAGRGVGEWMDTNRHATAQALLGSLDPDQLAGFMAVADLIIGHVRDGAPARVAGITSDDTSGADPR
jgi:DNA-binding MarR family transcriptional regulator